MHIYPKNVVELMDLFPNEEACLEYLSIMRWPNSCQCDYNDPRNLDHQNLKI